MKKIITSFVFILFINIVAFGQQTFTVYSDEELTSVISNNDTLTVIADSSSQVSFDFFAYLKNNTSSDLDVHIALQPIYISDDNILQLCYGGTCFTSLYCDGTIPVASPGELHITLYYTSSDTQANIVQVNIYNNSKGDTSRFYVRYKHQDTEASFNPMMPTLKVSKPFPNPANEFVKFKYSNPTGDNAYLTIYSILGDPIISKKINNSNGILNINTSKLKTGYYIYTVSINNRKIITNRFLVKH
jgi:hypothetical protein